MKKNRCLLFIVVVSIFLFTGKKADAFQWNSPMKDSEMVTTITDSTPIEIDETAISLGWYGLDNQLIFYTSNGVEKGRQSAFKAGTHNLSPQESIKLTKVGIRDGRYVDMYLTNVSSATAHGTFQINGTVRFNRSNQVATESASRLMNMRILDSETGIEYKNQAFYFPTFTSATATSYGTYVRGFDKELTKRFYIPEKNIIMDETRMDSTTFSNMYMMSSIIGLGYNGQNAEFTIYGDTGIDGYDLGNYNSGSSSSSIYFFQPNLRSVLPVPYPSLQISNDIESVDDGRKLSFTMVQQLPDQTQDRYIPVNNSFSLIIKEKNTDFLQIESNDFTLKMGDVVVSKDNYSISVIENEEITTIKINLTTEFIKSINKNNGGQSELSIVQSSYIRNDKSKIESNLIDYKAQVFIEADLNYQLIVDNVSEINMNATTPEELTTGVITPQLSAEFLENIGILKGTIAKDVPINTLISDPRNAIFEWDEVLVSNDQPDLIFDKSGDYFIRLILHSTTFGNNFNLDVPIDVLEQLSIKYDGNGATGTPPEDSFFNSQGTTLPAPNELYYANHIFIGWSELNSDVIYLPGYRYGDITSERHNSVLYAIWKPYIELTTSWQEKEISTDKKTSVDRSLESLQLAYFWKTTGELDYTVEVSYSDKKLAEQVISNYDKNQSMTEESITFPLDLLNYGENLVEINFFEHDPNQVNEKKKLVSTLNLMVNVEGTLSIKTVPESLNWTNRTSRETKGLLDRDINNEMTLEVVDSRNVSHTEKSWYLQTNVSYKEDVPFTLVWRQDLESQPVIMTDNNINVLSAQDGGETNNYNYSKEWNNNTGVLLQSPEYLKVGDYQNKVIVTWSLYDVKSIE